jgi:transcriptional regulator with AAA-type ATPase domain
LAEDLKNKVAKLISKENKKDPLTDEQIAQQCSVLRETVTGIRKSLNIPGSRDRKRKTILNVIETIKVNDPDITISRLTAKVESKGFKVSRSYIADMLNHGDPDDHDEQPNVGTEQEIATFSRLVGYEGSLLKNVKQGQAAILYPPFGLPTLIVGESGTGKTLFAEYMYKYAVQKKVIKENAPFVSLNCADYSDNPQLLVSILYGYKKGTFTGADQDTEGLVERANHGMLFLDEIHRLPPKGQEMLFSILDKGKFRRMGEVDADREAHIYFIGATTENIESSLLLTFRRRIPMIIELPALEERSLQEKVQLIYGFFQEEANRTNDKILVNAKIMAAFACKKYSGNIGQLKSEIQVTCANAYVDKINNKREEIYIGFNEILYQNFFYDINISKITMTFNDSLFIPHIIDREDAFITTKNHYSLPEDIYKTIENKYYELKQSHISSAETEKIIWDFLLNYFDKLRLESKNKHLTSLDELKYLVSNKIILLLKNFMETVKDH